MGTQNEEKNWVDVANNLLTKCHINSRLRKLTDCDANVFITLYENILGEKVPDYITVPRSQEDDIHNVQSVIDSLSLDYLQISLSHITGENIVRGDKEAIKNLLEIFDGLLDYLNEEGEHEDEIQSQLNEDEQSNNTKETSPAAMEGTSLSTDAERQSLHSCSAEELGSANELIGLGVSARTFANKQDGVTPSNSEEMEELPLSELMPSAVALQPPTQSDAPHGHGANTLSYSHPPTAAVSGEESGAAVRTKGRVTNGARSPGDSRSSTTSESSVSSQEEGETTAKPQTLQPTSGAPRKVLFRTQPDELFLTLQEEISAMTPSSPDTEEEVEEQEGEELVDVEELVHVGKDKRQRNVPKYESRGISHRRRCRVPRVDLAEPLSTRRLRNKQAEEELHHISEKLSQRLEELDEMLKRVLGETQDSSDVGEEQQRPQRTPLLRTHRKTKESSLPSEDRHSAHEELEDAIAEALSLEDESQEDSTAGAGSRREKRLRPSHNNQHSEGGAYEEELRRCEEKQRAEVQKARLKAQKAEREYRDAILGCDSEVTRTSSARPKTRHRTQIMTRKQRRLEPCKKALPLKISDNDLLPVLRDELPHLHISRQALGRMWERQMQQVDRIYAATASTRRSKLSSQLEEAQKKYDLLMDLVRKDQEHSQRLKDFKERIKQQKSAQNRVREQRQQIARAKKYHSDYHVQHRARMMRARTKEERMFRQLFEEGLEYQKARLREQRAFAKEQRQENQRRQRNQIESMENYYKDQFSILAEKLAHEREEIQVRKKAQEKALLKIKRELRSRMEREIGELQRIIIQNNEEEHFHDLEVQRMRNKLHAASYKHNSSHLL